MESFITFFSQWTEHTATSSLSGQNADLSKGECSIPLCDSPRSSTAEKMLSFLTETISIGFIFSIKCCPCSNPSTPESVHSSYTLFRNTNRCLDGITAFGPRHSCRSSSHTCGIITNIHWNRRHVASLGKETIMGKKFSPFSRHYTSLPGIDHCSEFHGLGLAFKRNGSIYVTQGSRNA